MEWDVSLIVVCGWRWVFFSPFCPPELLAQALCHLSWFTAYSVPLHDRLPCPLVLACNPQAVRCSWLKWAKPLLWAGTAHPGTMGGKSREEEPPDRVILVKRTSAHTVLISLELSVTRELSLKPRSILLNEDICLPCTWTAIALPALDESSFKQAGRKGKLTNKRADPPQGRRLSYGCFPVELISLICIGLFILLWDQSF